MAHEHMNHAAMGHGDMDHGGHDMPGMGGHKCNMNVRADPILNTGYRASGIQNESLCLVLAMMELQHCG